MAVVIIKNPDEKIDKIAKAKKTMRNHRIKHIIMWSSIALNVILLLGVAYGRLF